MRSLNEWWRDNLSTTAHNTQKMIRNSFDYGQHTCVGYNPNSGNIIVSDFGSMKGLERGKRWMIQKLSTHPKHIYLFELAEGDENTFGERLHLYTVPTFGTGDYEPRQDIIQSWEDRGAKFLAHTIYFHQLPKCLEWAEPF